MATIYRLEDLTGRPAMESRDVAKLLRAIIRNEREEIEVKRRTMRNACVTTISAALFLIALILSEVLR